MTLRYVAHLVGQHGRQFVSVAHDTYQAQMQTEITARQGKGVDGPVAPKHDLPSKALLDLGRHFAAGFRCSQQRLPDAVDVFEQDGIIQVVRVAVDLPRNAVAQAALGRCCERAVVTQRG